MENFVPGQPLKVKATAPFHKNKIGFFKFMGGPNADCVVMYTEKRKNYESIICVDPEHVEPAGELDGQ